MANDPSEEGRKPRVKNQEITKVFREADEIVLTASEVADELPIQYRSTLKRLKQLEKDGLVRSRTFNAGGSEVIVWWHNIITWPREESQSESADYKIGVEAVDELNLPGDEDELKSRRQAVNIIFRYLFFEETGSSSELQKIAWAADQKTTYGSPASLWKGCIIDALNESPFFVFDKSIESWKLTHLGSEMKEVTDGNVLWNNWQQHKEVLQERLLEDLWLKMNQFISRRSTVFSGISPGNRPEVSFINEKGMVLIFALRFDQGFWVTLTGELDCRLRVIGDQEVIETLTNAKATINSEMDTALSWSRSKTDDNEDILSIIASKNVEFDPSTIDLQEDTNRANLEPSILEPGWLLNTAEQFHGVFHEWCG